MKILIGTPVHRVKDYSIKRWLEAVSKLSYPVEEMFLVDNSPDLEYQEYLKTIVPTNMKTTITHMEIPYTDPEERVAVAREEIRRKVLTENFDYWFSWEEDTIAPPHVLDELLRFTPEFKVVHHTSPSRNDPDFHENSFGISLIHRDILEKYGFYLEWGTIDPLMPRCYHGVDNWFNRRILRDGGKFIELSGVVRPTSHLNE